MAVGTVEDSDHGVSVRRTPPTLTPQHMSYVAILFDFIFFSPNRAILNRAILNSICSEDVLNQSFFSFVLLNKNYYFEVQCSARNPPSYKVVAGICIDVCPSDSDIRGKFI